MLYHVVHFKYAASTSPEQRADVVARFLALKTECLNNEGSPYIFSLTGGKNISTEGYDRGYLVCAPPPSSAGQS